MELKKIRVHTCSNQRVIGYIEQKCRCRKYVTLEKAAELIDSGYAANVVKSFKVVEIKEPCSVCEGLEALKKSCSFCKKTGEVTASKTFFEYGEDVYMRPFLKTPRTATIEEEHIEYAFVKRDRDAIRRIDLYHVLNQEALALLGARIINSRTKEVLFEGTPEPEDDPKKHTGRTYDYGRSI